MSAKKQKSRVVYKATGNNGGNCCHYSSNYETRKTGFRCRVCGTVYSKMPEREKLT